MDQAYQALINSIDDHETTCPACNTKGIHNLKEIFNQKKKIYEECNKSLFGNFKFSNNIEKEKQIEKLTAKMRAEKQFNRQIEIKRQIKQLQQKIKDLNNG